MSSASRIVPVYEVGTGDFFRSVVDRLLSGKIVVPIPPQLSFLSAESLLDAVREYVTDDTEPGVIYTTSGTSGGAKLIHRSLNSLLHEAEATRTAFQMNDITPVCITSPLSHSFGFAMALAAYGANAEFSAVRSRTNIFERMRDIRMFVDGRPGAIVTGVPFMFHSLLRGDVSPFKEVRCYAGGDFVRPTLIHHWWEKTGRPLGREYGLSEAGIISVSQDGDPADSVGSLVPGVNARIEYDGEILVYRRYLPTSYLKGESPQSFTPGAGFLTGDLGEKQLETGRLFIRGRKKNIIVVGGMKIVPEEVEKALCKLPGILDAMVVKKTDPLRGDVPVAYVVIDGERATHMNGVRRDLENLIEPHKIPRSIEVVDDLPRNDVGKVVRS